MNFFDLRPVRARHRRWTTVRNQTHSPIIGFGKPDRPTGYRVLSATSEILFRSLPIRGHKCEAFSSATGLPLAPANRAGTIGEEGSERATCVRAVRVSRTIRCPHLCCQLMPGHCQRVEYPSWKRSARVYVGGTNRKRSRRGERRKKARMVKGG